MNPRDQHPFDDDDDYGDDPELDEFEEAMQNCSGFFHNGVFHCSAAGSEDCDWGCPFSDDIGLTEAEIDEREAREDTEMFEEQDSQPAPVIGEFIVHKLLGGFAMCGRNGVPSSWGPGEKWSSELEDVNCEGCKKAVAEALKEKADVDPERG